jgi:hypothetical protein
MPVASGFEATALIRKFEIEHNLPPVPIVALTAHAMIGYRVSPPRQLASHRVQEKCLEAGMTEYLTKPLDKKGLLMLVHKCATTVPILHPNLSKVIDVTPDTELGNPLDGTHWEGVSPRDSRHGQTLLRPASRGALVRASTSPD